MPYYRQITSSSLATYLAYKYFLCFMLFSYVPIYYRITTASHATFHAFKYFLFLMFFSDVPIYRQVRLEKTLSDNSGLQGGIEDGALLFNRHNLTCN